MFVQFLLMRYIFYPASAMISFLKQWQEDNLIYKQKESATT